MKTVTEKMFRWCLTFAAVYILCNAMKMIENVTNKDFFAILKLDLKIPVTQK